MRLIIHLFSCAKYSEVFIRSTGMAFIASLDVGTTTVRCFIVNEKCEIKGSATELVELLNPEAGYFEIEPEALWLKIVKVITTAIKDAQLKPEQISCLGISSQRCTFLSWNHRTKEYFHNFITWKDLRSDALVDQWNNGLMRKTLNTVSYALYLLTRSNRFLAASVLKMMNGQVTQRLKHAINSNSKLQQAFKDRTARIELLDSWILYKLRSGNGLEPNVEHITDITSATGTGLFDPFILDWSSMVNLLFGIDRSLLPKIVNNAYKDFGCVHPATFQQHDPDWNGVHIPITSSISDQTAAMWGSHCFDEGDVKITMGTGAFLNLITGRSCHASLLGMYPLVAWQFCDISKKVQTTYCVEGAAHDMGTVIAWAQSCGLINDPKETSAIAESVEDTGGVFFVPAFSGLGVGKPPINDHKAASGFFGITPSTTHAHLVRAILESIAFRLAQLCETTEQETNYRIQKLKVDGGVSRNNFVCQFLSDVTGIQVERAQNSESSIMGASYMAGLNFGLWSDVDHIRKYRKIDRTFIPSLQKRTETKMRMDTWNKAVKRFTNWY